MSEPMDMQRLFDELDQASRALGDGAKNKSLAPDTRTAALAAHYVLGAIVIAGRNALSKPTEVR